MKLKHNPNKRRKRPGRSAVRHGRLGVAVTQKRLIRRFRVTLAVKAKVSKVSEREGQRRKRRADKTNELAEKAGVNVDDLVGTTLDRATEIDALARLASANENHAAETVRKAIRCKDTDTKINARKELSALEAQAKDEETKLRRKEKE